MSGAGGPRPEAGHTAGIKLTTPPKDGSYGLKRPGAKALAAPASWSGKPGETGLEVALEEEVPKKASTVAPKKAPTLAPIAEEEEEVEDEDEDEDGEEEEKEEEEDEEQEEDEEPEEQEE